MEHWSKTSSVEPLPVGRHKKRNKDVDCGRPCYINGDDDYYYYPSRDRSKFQNTVEVYPVVRTPHRFLKRPVDAARNTKADYIDHKKKISGFQDESSVDDHHVDKEKKMDGSSLFYHKGKSCFDLIIPFPEKKDGAAAAKWRSVQENQGDQKSTTTAKGFILKNDDEKGSFGCTSNSGESKEEYNQDKSTLARRRVKAILSDFRAFCDHLFEIDQTNRREKKKELRRVDIVATKMIKNKYGYPNRAFLGSIPGVEVGDQFRYRMELHVLGLHRPPQGGIDFMNDGGIIIAISVVDSGGYDNYMSNTETLIYCGQGGNDDDHHQGCCIEDWKLKKGNLALMNSIKTKNPVRVIRGRKQLNSFIFFYDGLYTVEKMLERKNLGGNLILKFKLVRIPGQPSSLARRN